jgi:CheY-like chemotaxis protein
MAIRVLVVDDSMVARKILIRALPTGWAHAVDQAKDGMDALDRLREAAYDVVFLDLNMPELDGYSVLEELRRAPPPGGIPMTFVLSGDIQPRAVERALALGAREFLKKPPSAAEIQGALEKAGVR